MQRWYVYYRLPARDTPLMVDAARAMIERVSAQTGVRGRLQRKCDELTDSTTLMEVYEAIADVSRFERALEQAVAASAFTPAQRAARRVERFEDL
jgi:hypothetical protein